MKNNVFTFMSLAVAAVAVLSCTEMPDNGTIEQDPKAEGVTIRVISGKTPTKTMAVDGEIPTIQWADSDKISLFEIVDDDVKGSAQSGDACIDGEGRACFNTTLGWEDPGGSAYQYSAVYPADNVIEEGGKYYIFIPAKQTLKENNFSEDSDVLFSTPLDHGTTRVSDGEDVMFSFRRLGTVVRLTLAGIDEGTIISEVTIKAPTNIAGAIEYDPVTGTVNPESAFVYNSSNTVSLTLDDLEATGSDVLWFRVMCGEAWAAGAKFTIKVMTDKAVYEKEVTLPSAIKFPDGGLTKFRVNLEGCHPEPVQVPCVWNFEGDAEGWSFYDKDGDGYGWKKASDTGLSMSGSSFLYSASYDDNIGALSPDNWAFTPPIQLTEGNYLSFWTRPKQEGWPYAYAVYITDESPTGTMTTLLPLDDYHYEECAEWGSDGIYQHFVIQIPGEFDNEIVYIAFQHNDYSQSALILDDVAVTEENPIQDATATYEDYLGKWAKGTRVYTIESKVDGESYSISGLNGQGDYEVEAKFEDHRLVLYEQIVAQDGDKTVALQGSGNKDPGYPDGTPVVIFSALYDKGNNQLSINHESAYNYIDFFTYEGQTMTDDVYEEIPVSLIPYVPDIATYLYYEDFESDNSSSWTFIDADGDGKLWWRSGASGRTYSGDYVLTSASYDNATYGALHPDNWAFTPPVTLTSNNYLSFWVRAQDPNYPAEHYAVYITDDAPTAANLGDCTVLLAEQEYPNGNYVALAGDGYYQRYVIQIPSSFDGKTVYIGFRHFNCSDQFQLTLDDVAVAQGNPVTD